MLTAFARVRPEVTLAQVAGGSRHRRGAAAASCIRTTIRRPDSARIEVPLKDELTRNFRPTLWILLGTAGFVLLIVCASIANLLLARMVRREREISVRAALGATRARLLRQLLTESLLLAVAGGAARAGAVGVLAASCWSPSPSASRRARTRSRSTCNVLLFTLGVSIADRADLRIDPGLLEAARHGAGAA